MRIRFISCKNVTGALVDEVARFSESSYEIDQETLSAKLRSGDSLGMARDRDGALKAVAVIKGRRLKDENGAFRVLATSHVLTAPDARGGTILHRFGVRSVIRERLRHPFVPMYWFFLTTNYRSYLLMVRNFARFSPDPRGEDAELVRRSGIAAASLLTGIWTSGPTAPGSRAFGALRSHEMRIPEVSEEARPYVEHFLKLNPSYSEGNGLVCFAPLDWKNLFHIVLRMLRKTLTPRTRSRVTRPRELT